MTLLHIYTPVDNPLTPEVTINNLEHSSSFHSGAHSCELESFMSAPERSATPYVIIII